MRDSVTIVNAIKKAPYSGLALKHIKVLSVGCTALASLCNVQQLAAYACEAASTETTASDCAQTTKTKSSIQAVDPLNSPAIQTQSPIQWSPSQLIADGLIPESHQSKEALGSPTKKPSLPSQTTKHLPPEKQTYLQVGDMGDQVYDLQKRLNEIGLETTVDGIFGVQTKHSVLAFQASRNLIQDGVVGPETYKALFIDPSGNAVNGSGNGQPVRRDRSADLQADNRQVSPSPQSSQSEATPPPAVSSSKLPAQQTATDIDGGIENTAVASSVETNPKQDSKQVPIAGQPILGLDKSVVEILNPDGTVDPNGIVDEAGDIVNYTITATNAGNVSLTGVSIVDALTGDTLATDETLDVDEVKVFGYRYTVRQSDIDDDGGGDSSLDNKATANSNQTSAKSDSESVPIQQMPALRVNKTATGIDTKNDGILNQAGDVIDYLIAVENTGNQTLTNVSINDPTLGNQFIDELASGDRKTFTARYVLTQADIDTNGGGDGDIDNTVIATADQINPVKDFAEILVVQVPDLTIEKRVLEVDETGDGVLNNPGEIVAYEVIVTNSGNQTLTNVTLQDPLFGGVIEDNVTLAPGQSKSYSLAYAITQKDIDNNGNADDRIASLIPTK